MDIHIGNDSSMITAWLLDTLGSRAKFKRSIKKSVLQSLIPLLCKELSTGRKPIRYSSKILHGISLMYSLKMDYFIDEINLFKNRVDRQLLFHHHAISFEKSYGHKKIQLIGFINDVPQTRNSRLLLDDPLFNIFLDLVPSYECDGIMENDRRRRRLFQEDTQNFLETQYSNINVNNHANLMTDVEDYQRRVDDFMDQEFDYSNPETTMESAYSVFQFNSDGQILGQIQADEFEIEPDFDPEKFNLQENKLSEKDTGNHASISRDDDFFISTGEIRTSENQLNLGKLKKTILHEKEYQVKKDAATTLARNDLEHLVETYNKVMETNAILTTSSSLKLTDVYTEFKRVPPFVHYCQKVIFGNRITNQVASCSIDEDTSNLNREIELIRRVQMMENQGLEFEIGRDVALREEGLLQDEPDYNVLFNVPQEQLQDDILNISFGGDDTSSVHLHQVPYRAPIENERQEYELSNTLISPQLTQYLSFIHLKSRSIGETVVSTNWPLYDANGEPANNGAGVISLSKLMPNISDPEEIAISRKLAAKSFSSLLTLASRNFVGIRTKASYSWQVLCCYHIDVIIPN